MKSKIVFLCLCFIVSLVAVKNTEAFTVSPFIGYSTLTMSKVDRGLNARAGSLYGNTPGRQSQFGKSTCTVVGLELGAFRFTYLGSPTPMKASIQWTDPTARLINDSISTTLMSGMIGFRIPHPGGALLHLGIFAGYGMADVTESFSVNNGTPVKIKASASGPVAEANMGLKIFIIELSASYRYAIFNKMLVTSFDPSIPAIIGQPLVKGKAIKDPTDKTNVKDLVYDYGGIYVTAGLRFGPGPKKEVDFEKTLKRYFGNPAWYRPSSTTSTLK